MHQALVGYPYFVGSLTYTAGTYMGYYEAREAAAPHRLALPTTSPPDPTTAPRRR